MKMTANANIRLNEQDVAEIKMCALKGITQKDMFMRGKELYVREILAQGGEVNITKESI